MILVLKSKLSSKSYKLRHTRCLADTVGMAILYFVLTMAVPAGGQSKQAAPVFLNESGKLVYSHDNKGNRIPDFSYSGYMAGEKPIPDVPIQIVVPIEEGDDTRRIQSALDYVASLPADEGGIRGAVLLEQGTYKVSGSLAIEASGVVLRGSGMNKEGTLLVGTGQSRETLIRIAGQDDRRRAPEIQITDEYVPVNALEFSVEDPNAFQVGDNVSIRRPSTEGWIQELGMSEFGGETGWLGWKPGERDIMWDRKVIAVNGNRITIDAPITTALDSAYGGGRIASYQWPGRIRQAGVENLRLVSAYDKERPKDEDHRWMAITLENIRDAWVRQIVFKYFAGSAVAVLHTGKRITVEDSKSLHPVSEIGGQRRYTFWTKGQQTLFQRLYAEQGYHDFAVGYLATLNAFVQCESHRPHSFSGAINSWASGALFDIVRIDGGALKFFNRKQGAHGAGWTAANSVLWQCSAAKVACYKPPTANNWAFGIWAQFAGDGYWGNINDHIQPRSLYYAQLDQRLGEDSAQRAAHLLPFETGSTSSPTIGEAEKLAEISRQPARQLSEWIENAPTRNPIPTQTAGVKRLNPSDIQEVSRKKKAPAMQVKNGWLVRGDQVITGKKRGVRWWRGEVRPYAIEEASPHITRYVPGHYGHGLTDSLERVTNWMEKEHVVALEHNYGLWYERRRDDHQRVRRLNGDVWPPFYELPFARSGKGTAWDGLSKYDLTTYNHWYWDRLGKFADLADQKGLVLIHQNYFQHNVLEAGAHWADFPWRTANNINSTGFPEPPNYAGDKRIFMSKQFYDVTHPQRRAIHQCYINKGLSNFTDNNNVIQFIGAEYTGPLHFVQFWIDTVQEWERTTGNDSFIGLRVTKDVQDAILADKDRAQTVDLIDIRRWHYREDGSLYAPIGGQHLAPRQHARLVDRGKSSFDRVYQAVREYREKHPGKAVMYSGKGFRYYGWAVFMAGGSLAELPPISDPTFWADAVKMKPVELRSNSRKIWTLGNNRKNEYIIYTESPNSVQIDLRDAKGDYSVKWLDPDTGDFFKKEELLSGGRQQKIDVREPEPVVLWIKKHKS